MRNLVKVVNLLFCFILKCSIIRVLTFSTGGEIEKSNELSLEIGDLVVYPIYGVGDRVPDTYDIDGSSQDFILINFKQDK